MYGKMRTGQHSDGKVTPLYNPLGKHALNELEKFLFTVKYQSIAFAILPGLTGGLALELKCALRRATIICLKPLKKATMRPGRNRTGQGRSTDAPYPPGRQRVRL